MQIYSRVKQEGEQRENSIPFYAIVPGPDPDARFPRTRSERPEMSVRGAPAYNTSGGGGGARIIGASLAATPQDSRQSWGGGGSVMGMPAGAPPGQRGGASSFAGSRPVSGRMAPPP